MAGKNRNISIENIIKYIPRERIVYLTSKSVKERLNVVSFIIVALFFSGTIIAIAGIGFYFVLLLKERNQTFFEIDDIFANILHNGIHFWMLITICYFYLFIYLFFTQKFLSK